MEIEKAKELLGADPCRVWGCDIPSACCDHTKPYLRVLIVAVEALGAEKGARLATGRQSTCEKQVHGDSHIQCGKCFICLERTALGAFEKL